MVLIIFAEPRLCVRYEFLEGVSITVAPGLSRDRGKEVWGGNGVDGFEFGKEDGETSLQIEFCVLLTKEIETSMSSTQKRSSGRSWIARAA